MVSIRNFTVAGGRHGTAAMVPSSRGGETALGREFGSNMRIFRHGTDTFASPKFLTRGVLEPVDADFGATDDRGFIDGAPGDSTPNIADIRAVPIHEVRRIDLVVRIVRDDVPAIATELVGWCMCPIWLGND